MRLYFSLILTFIVAQMSNAQSEYNYDESKVPQFEVPNLLKTSEGEVVKTSQDWVEKRRPELYSFFEEQVYGRVPGELDGVSFEIIEEGEAMEGTALRKQIKITLAKNGKSLSYVLLIFLPKDGQKVSVFLGYDFFGNHSITKDNKVLISDAWAMNSEALGVNENKLTETSRGQRAHRWAIDKIIEGGFGLATIYYGEVDPDKHDFSDGLHSLFYEMGQERPKNDEWGSIAAWAFGMSTALDYFEQDNDIDEERIIAFGHSRLGKAALWAGARDQRFAGVISNDSGCGGAAMSKRKFGETVARINTSFPHWFCDNFNAYNDNEEALPFDQHQLLALIAPRPLYVASAQEDEWADPKGEFLSALYASSVYKLYGEKGISSSKMPEVNQPIQNTLSYHLRTGKHDVTDYDWEQYLKWAKRFVE